MQPDLFLPRNPKLWSMCTTTSQLAMHVNPASLHISKFLSGHIILIDKITLQSILITAQIWLYMPYVTTRTGELYFLENFFSVHNIFCNLAIAALITMGPANNIWLERCPKSIILKEYMASIGWEKPPNTRFWENKYFHFQV